MARRPLASFDGRDHKVANIFAFLDVILDADSAADPDSLSETQSG
jgi:hypothetical protein